MALRSILRADDPKLRQKSKKIKRFGPSLKALIDDMVETMQAVNGLGLAAPQIGVQQRVIIIQLPKDDEDPQSGQLIALCNPEIVRVRGEEEGEEGCLSVPGYVGLVKRATSVTVKGYDLKGKETRLKADGLLARAFQHEIDHLDGILFIDRVESPDKLRRLEATEDKSPASEEALM